MTDTTEPVTETRNLFIHFARIAEDVELPPNFRVMVGRDDRPQGRFFYQIKCWRKDVITGEWDWGFGSRAFLDERATDSQLVGTIFGLYKSYVEHEARETFLYQGARIYGPHLRLDALISIARKVDIPSAQHASDIPPAGSLYEGPEDVFMEMAAQQAEQEALAAAEGNEP